MEPHSVKRKLTAILSADVKGYSRLMGEDEVATIRTLTAYREVMATLIQQHQGRVVDSPGDNLLAEFASAVDAVQCAVEVQRELKVRNAELPPDRKMEFRIGINVGDVVVEGERLYGDGVNVAARLESLAEPGGIGISGTVYDQVENKLALGYEYLGEQTVKNITKPVRMYRVQLEPGAAAPKFTVGAALRGRPKVPQYWRRAALAVMAVLLLVGVGAVVIRSLYFRPPPALELPDKPSIAVLPFTNMSGDPEQEYFGDGMTDDLITDLSKLSGLVVIARHSVFTYKGKAVKMEEVSRELGVRYVLEGSVRKADNRVRVNAQLVDATTGGHLWAERYDRPLRDIFALQDEIRQKIIMALKVKLTKEEQVRFKYAPTDNLEAYDYVLRGLEHYWRLTKEDNAQARQMFEKALELDPTYAAAYRLLGWTHFNEWGSQWSQDPRALERAFESAQKAITLDDSLPSAHELLGIVYLFRNKQYEQAMAEVERAIAHSPNWYSAYTVLGIILNFAGRPEETIALQEQALRLSPRSLDYLSVLGHAYSLTGRYEEAIATYKKVLTFLPHYLHAHHGLAATYSELGREEEARTEAAEVLRLNPHFSLEVLRQRSPYKDPAVLERVLAALHKAGLK